MDQRQVQLIRWYLRRATHGLSWFVVVAAALIALDAAIYASVLRPALGENNVMAREMVRLRSVRAAHPTPETAPVHPEHELAAFYRALVRPRQMPEVLRRLHDEAASVGLEVQKAEYRPLPEAGGKLIRYQIALPARGSYPDVRRFLERIMRDVPGLAIDSVGLQRQNVGGTVLEAQIKLTLFLGAEQ